MGVPERVSVVVPTLNEAENIDELVRRALDAGGAASLDIEMVFVDDGSTDGTRDRVRTWERDHPVILVERNRERGLAGAVLAGAARASGRIVLVMDADLSHPPEKIPELARPVLDGSADMTIGSRHVPGGDIPGWPLARRVTSRGAALLAWPLVEARDPMSGFFCLERERLLEWGKAATGFKIGLELLVQGGDDLRVKEVPIVFRDRTRGESKLGPEVMIAYLRQLAVLAGGFVPAVRPRRLALALLAAAAIDIISFQAILSSGVSLGSAQLASFLPALALGGALCARWAFAMAGPRRRGVAVGRVLRLAVVGLLAVLLRGGLLALLVRKVGLPPALALLPAMVLSAVVMGLGSVFFVLAPPWDDRREALRWRVTSVLVLAYLVVLRLVFLGQIDLIPEEAYYWLYSRHMDLSFLDHPPMVAWVIWVGTALFGKNEFGVRIGAEASWLVALVFASLLSRNLLGRSAAFRSAMLLAVLPFFFAIGFLTMPDSPLIACWAAALWGLERALLGGRRSAWWGVGIALGLGALSKYYVALLGPAILAFVTIDPPSRRWLRSLEPYGAALLAVAIFSPVLIWNAQHDWASFLFQGPGRYERTEEFGLPELLGFVFLLITPMGVLGAFLGALRRASWASGPAGAVEPSRRRRFVTVFAFVPLAIFVLLSIRNQSKLNWTGPVWLAALPAMALTMLAAPGGERAGGGRLLRILWHITVVASLVGCGVGLYVPVLGLPGVSLPPNYYTRNWRQLGEEVAKVKREVAERMGSRPLVVGMDKYHLSCELAFYYPDGDGPRNTATAHLFTHQPLGQKGLMFEYWLPKEAEEGKTLVLVCSDTETLELPKFLAHVSDPEPIREIDLERNGAPAGRYYVRVVHAYKSADPEASGGR